MNLISNALLTHYRHANCVLNHRRNANQQGGTTLGVIVGVVLGLFVALGVSLYLAYSGAPVQTKAANTAARIEPPADASKAPDPNQSLYTKVPKSDDKTDSKTDSKTDGKTDSKTDGGKDKEVSTQKEPAAPTSATAQVVPSITPAPVKANASVSNKTAEQDGIGKIAAIVTPAKPTVVAAPPAPLPTLPPAAAVPASAKPNDSIAMPKAASPTSGERYFVQAGAFANAAEAEAMKARLALQGVSMSLSPRDKDGQILQRVRTAPLAAVDAERLRNTLKANGIETSLVKVQ